MKHGSLFSGVGGFDLAAEWMGWENVFHCEWAEYQRQLLKLRFPNSISYHDIKSTDFTIHRGQIDILSGGFPCQPFSTAGKRKGTEDDRYRFGICVVRLTTKFQIKYDTHWRIAYIPCYAL